MEDTTGGFYVSSKNIRKAILNFHHAAFAYLRERQQEEVIAMLVEFEKQILQHEEFKK